MDNLKNWRKGKKTKVLLSRRKKHPGNISALMKTTDKVRKTKLKDIISV
jgi:hypothetical protein